VLVAACPVRGSHTADNTAKLVKDTLEKRKVADKVHVFLRDKGRNMIASLRHVGVPSVSCFSHMLQLCVK
jgi:hypothetical protein